MNTKTAIVCIQFNLWMFPSKTMFAYMQRKKGHDFIHSISLFNALLIKTVNAFETARY